MPPALPPLPTILTPTLLSSIRTHPQLPQHSWYFIAGVTLSVINRPDEIPNVFNHALENDTINALFALKTATPPHLLDEPMAYSPSARPAEVSSVPTSQILHRGQRFFDKVYGKVSKRVMGQMDRSGTEDLGVTARLMYGYLLSNTNILTPAESSFVLLAGLIPQDVNPQLKGHLKGALNNGATVDEVKAVRDVVIRICEASGMTRLGNGVAQGWGWRGDVANL
ncbi:hypothetical protein LTR39_001083 [Cryomyces antarcticus]|nr:hypothetical protein LTR39_001083 [Cryomyces antarcticus]